MKFEQKYIKYTRKLHKLQYGGAEGNKDEQKLIDEFGIEMEQAQSVLEAHSLEDAQNLFRNGKIEWYKPKLTYPRKIEEEIVKDNGSVVGKDEGGGGGGGGGGGPELTNIINCEKEGFNIEIRNATFGQEYPLSIVSHDNSEKWPYKRLVDTSTHGMVGWYCKQAKLTPEECQMVTSIPVVQILGVFFHRYKVFLEHIETAKAKLKDIELWETIEKKPKINEIKDRKSPCDICFIHSYEFVKLYISKGSEYEKFQTADLPIQQTIDRIQCLLWVIVKNKSLPHGFIMDERIKRRAEEPILFYTPIIDACKECKISHNDFSDLSSSSITFYMFIIQLANLINIVNKDNIEFGDPEVSFGLKFE
jgi:hypothetical protein